EARGVPGVPAHYDAGITRGLGVPSAFYHFAFEAGSEAGLEDKRRELRAKGVEVTDVVDHDWAKSIYFKDPNGIQLEFCCFTRNLNANDARMQDRFEMAVRRLGLQDPEALGGVEPVIGVEDPAPAHRAGAPAVWSGLHVQHVAEPPSDRGAGEEIDVVGARRSRRLHDAGRDVAGVVLAHQRHGLRFQDPGA